ncbi:MAG: DNA polymerase III subunit gamma/tau [Vicinamibacteria bacterium]|nr:DNA polymerase III subunit gamma/tau [Vicinamibacteria bacterium]
MSYQVIARKWRPQRFDDVVGQQAVTQTLRNALASGRLAQAFVFAGARGVGKTTTARILARALNCIKGPTPDPCGECDACVEIAQGRDLDVLEIDAASHTGIDNVREVIISNLAITPARDRYKIFIIDEVHQLSNHSFNALLKSVEEPPPHVVFIMATTELHKIPDTIQSRAQVYEFRTIATTAIAAQLRHIADAEAISIADDALTILARYAEGSMRDAQSAFDQVLSFSGATVTAADVAAVLGLVGHDLLFDILTAVADEDAAAAFALAGRAVEAGYDLRILCRELAGVVRAMTLVSIDPTRLSDPEVVLESDRARLQALVTRFSREDLLRSFDLVARAEADVRLASQPRYALEMALLKWIHLRKLVPLADLIGQLEKGGLAPAPPTTGTPAAVPKPAQSFGARPPFAPRQAPPLSRPPAPVPRPDAPGATTPAGAPDGPLPADFKDRFLAELQRQNRTFYNLHVATAQKIELDGGRLVFTFGPVHETMRQQVEARRQWLESLAESVAGRKVGVATARSGAADAPAVRPPAGVEPPAPVAPLPDADLRARAMADGGVQAMLDVFPAEIREVEEIK